MADHDALTGLFNRRRFEEELERHIAHGRRYGMGGALLLLDLDDFKRVNDDFGHRAGDRVLTAVAVVLKHRLRESDIVARFGGDEFAVLMPVGGVGEATELAELLGAAIRADVPTPAGPLSASVGIALFGDLSTRGRHAVARRRRDVRAEALGDGRRVRRDLRSGRVERAARSLQPCGSASSSRTRASPRGGRPRTSCATGG